MDGPEHTHSGGAVEATTSHVTLNNDGNNAAACGGSINPCVIDDLAFYPRGKYGHRDVGRRHIGDPKLAGTQRFEVGDTYGNLDDPSYVSEADYHAYYDSTSTKRKRYDVRSEVYQAY